MTDCLFDAGHELQRPVEPISPLAEALDRVGVCDPARSELLGLTGLTGALVNKTWMAVQLSDGDKGALIYRLKIAAKAAIAQAAVKTPISPPGEARRKWEQQAQAQTEARLLCERRAKESEARVREQLLVIPETERARCARRVLDEPGSQWLWGVCKSEDPLKSRILGVLTLTYWQRWGRTGDEPLLET